MAIQQQVTVTLATVDVTDEYRVELRQERRRTTYTPEQALELASDLIGAAASVDTALTEDMQELNDRLKAAAITTADGERVL